MADTYLIHRLNQMRMEGQLCDVHLVADDASTFPVHGLLFVAADENFYRYVVNANNGPIVIKAGVSRSELESVVHFVYGVQSSGKQVERGLQKMQMTRLLSQLSNISKGSAVAVGSTNMNACVSSSTEVKPVTNINDNTGSIYIKTHNYSVKNTCAGEINLHSPVIVKTERKSDMEPNLLDIVVSSPEFGKTVSLKQRLPETVKQEYLQEEATANMESKNSSFSVEIPMPSLVKCETSRYIPSCSEERTMPRLERIECKSAQTSPSSQFTVIVKNEPISPPVSPLPKVLPPDNSGIILEKCGLLCPESGYHVKQEAACSADHGLPNCFKERGQFQNEFSSCNRKLSTEDNRWSAFTSSLPVIKTEEDCFGETSDKYTLFKNDMLSLKDAQMLSTASTSEAQIMQMSTPSMHSGKVVQSRDNKLTDGNVLGICTQFLDQSQNSALGLPSVPGIPLYSHIEQSQSAKGIIIQNPPGAMVTLVPSAVSNLHVNFSASKLQQSMETYSGSSDQEQKCVAKFNGMKQKTLCSPAKNINSDVFTLVPSSVSDLHVNFSASKLQQSMETYSSSDQEQKCVAKFNGMKHKTLSSPTKNMNNSDISNFVVYPGKVMNNMGSSRGRKKFSKIPMIIRRNSVPFRKRSYDSLKITDVILHANSEKAVEVEPKKIASSGDLMQAGELNSSMNAAAVIDGQLNQSISRTQNEHTVPSCIGLVAEKSKPKCSKQTKPKFFHGYSTSFIPIAPKFEH
ncbi:hypothetical protein CHS0354_001513 [Potamilus streckersoni]|uniref:BTB domain-containing protein n=1 Tax=Potamilus streckersoni TaxID=2493646 RepID=A0AAE0VJ98_9BIVA|nr:hypothetical protein CHS0354_001513 [Potamilus streckersoni]